MSTVYPTQEDFAVTVPPSVEPITLQEGKDHLGVTAADDDTLITSQIIAARQYLESRTERAFIERSIQIDLPRWFGIVRIPLPDLVSITSIKYFDTASPETLQTLAATEYRANTKKGQVERVSGAAWPAHAPRSDAIQITAVVGYAIGLATDSPQTLAGAVPEQLKAGIKLMLTELFDIREVSIIGTTITENKTIQRIIDNYRIYL